MIGVINAHMFGTQSAPGEYVDWSAPDIASRQDWYDLLGVTVEEYAETAPHMIVFETPGCPCGLDHDLTTQDGAETCRTITEERDRQRNE